MYILYKKKWFYCIIIDYNDKTSISEQLITFAKKLGLINFDISHLQLHFTQSFRDRNP